MKNKIIARKGISPTEVDAIVIHHTAVPRTNGKQFYRMEQYHKKRWGRKSQMGYYLGYNGFIDVNGKFTQTRALGEETMANKGYNAHITHIAFSDTNYDFPAFYITEKKDKVIIGQRNDKGTYDRKTERNKKDIVHMTRGRIAFSLCIAGNFNSELPNDKQVKQLKKLLSLLRTTYPRARITLHRDLDGNETNCPGSLLTNEYIDRRIMGEPDGDSPDQIRKREYVTRANKSKAFIRHHLDRTTNILNRRVM